MFQAKAKAVVSCSKYVTPFKIFRLFKSILAIYVLRFFTLIYFSFHCTILKLLKGQFALADKFCNNW